MVAQFTKGTCIKSWGQWSVEEEEKRDKWEEVNAAIKFVAGHNRDGGGGGPVEGI